MAIYTYDRSPAQVERLKEIAQSWAVSDRFWGQGLTLDAASRPGALILFAAQEKSAPWQGAILCEVGRFDAELLYIYTHPDMRGSGIGESLLRALGDRLRTKDMESMFLEVRVGNEGALHLYEKLGMERISVRKQYYSDGEDAFVYRWRFGMREPLS